MSTDDDNASVPKSMRHKQILDVARENPDASIEALASEVSSATPDLVKRVLDEHGDPGDEDDLSSEPTEETTSKNGSTGQADTPAVDATTSDSVAEKGGVDEQAPVGEDSSEDEPDRYPALEDLAERHGKLVEAVAAHPEAGQKELADHFDVTRATISRWANQIEGFEWSERESLVEAIFEEPPSVDLKTEDNSGPQTTSTGEGQAESTQSKSQGEGCETTETVEEIKAEIERLCDRVSNLEETDEEEATSSNSVFEDPELVHKIVHACMDSDAITESDELRILRELLE